MRVRSTVVTAINFTIVDQVRELVIDRSTVVTATNFYHFGPGGRMRMNFRSTVITAIKFTMFDHVEERECE